jgi:phosphoribosylglycinamide formyltransferase-1
MNAPARLVVLISGNGSNLQAIMDACSVGELNAKIVAVVANKATAFGLERARKAGIPALIKTKLPEQDRHLYDKELADMIVHYQPDWIVLAGWMRVLSADFLNQFPQRVINLHPALPDLFPGINAIDRAFAAYQKGEIKHTGVMVHLVPDEGVDCGPVLGQVNVSIYADDTLEMLTTRVHTAEHKLLIETLRKLIP